MTIDDPFSLASALYATYRRGDTPERDDNHQPAAGVALELRAYGVYRVSGVEEDLVADVRFVRRCKVPGAADGDLRVAFHGRDWSVSCLFCANSKSRRVVMSLEEDPGAASDLDRNLDRGPEWFWVLSCLDPFRGPKVLSNSSKYTLLVPEVVAIDRRRVRGLSPLPSVSLLL